MMRPDHCCLQSAPTGFGSNGSSSASVDVLEPAVETADSRVFRRGMPLISGTSPSGLRGLVRSDLGPRADSPSDRSACIVLRDVAQDCVNKSIGVERASPNATSPAAHAEEHAHCVVDEFSRLHEAEKAAAA